jgi:D-3-phosphoglycerate dehydrogenase
MDVIGYDPYLSVAAAWSLDRQVHHAETLDALLTKSDYITIHIPQTNDTKGFLNADKLRVMKDGVRIINIARGGLVVNADMIAAVESGKVAAFVTDFADEDLLACPKVICLPHLGASTPEAEDNCARMAVEELREYLEAGCIRNSVNFPKCSIEEPVPAGGTRLCIAHKNVPGMVAKFTTVLGDAKLNINRMINQNRGDLAYNIIDVEGVVPENALSALGKIPDVIKVRPIMG